MRKILQIGTNQNLPQAKISELVLVAYSSIKFGYLPGEISSLILCLMCWEANSILECRDFSFPLKKKIGDTICFYALNLLSAVHQYRVLLALSYKVILGMFF